MPKGQHAGLLAGQIARTEYGIGVPAQQRAQQGGVFGGIIFQIGVLDQAEVAARFLDGGADGGALAFVDLLAEEPDGGFFSRQPVENIGINSRSMFSGRGAASTCARLRSTMVRSL
jgi:hypothetical protein